VSTFSSLCHNKEHEHKIDVAYCYVTDQIRIIVWENDDTHDGTAYLDVDEAKHVVALMNQAIERALESELRLQVREV
jgi:hypothetical protein